MKQAFTVTVEGFAPHSDVLGVIKDRLDGKHGWDVTVEPHGEPQETERTGPLVSVLLPNYNQGHRIERMIASIRAQSLNDFELIVVDDGSTDESITKVRPLLGPRDRLLLHGKNRGAAAAINTAARFATGHLVTWVSADNEMTPDWLETLMGLMTPGVGVAYANYDRFNEAGPQPGTWGKPYDPERLLNDQSCYIGPAFLVRAGVWAEAGELRGKNSCDYDHWLRIEETCRRYRLKFSYHDGVLCHYYAGPERATVARRQDYDANVWQAEARKRRKRRDLGISEAVVIT